jgi:hypothetical protein
LLKRLAQSQQAVNKGKIMSSVDAWRTSSTQRFMMTHSVIMTEPALVDLFQINDYY